MQTLRDYILFAAGAVVSWAWFVVHHHWFLDVWLAGWSLHALCVAIIAAMALGTLLPGLVATKAPAALVGSVAVAQVCSSFHCWASCCSIGACCWHRVCHFTLSACE